MSKYPIKKEFFPYSLFKPPISRGFLKLVVPFIKVHWVSVLLPDAPEDVVRFLVSVSFELTEQKKKRVQNK